MWHNHTFSQRNKATKTAGGGDGEREGEGHQYRKRTNFEISQGVRFYQTYTYTFESQKWSLKNYFEFSETNFCHLEIIYFYHQGFTVLKRTTFWYFPLNQKKNPVANKEHQNLHKDIKNRGGK